MGGDGNRAVVEVFSPSRLGFCGVGGGFCLSLVVVAGLGLHFLKIDILHPGPNSRNNFQVDFPQHVFNKTCFHLRKIFSTKIFYAAGKTFYISSNTALMFIKGWMDHEK
ncbi:hypothetical protein ACB098_07G005100 [Castanea mollissima]